MLDVRRALTELTPRTEFDRHVGHCTICVGHTDITATVPFGPTHGPMYLHWTKVP